MKTNIKPLKKSKLETEPSREQLLFELKKLRQELEHLKLEKNDLIRQTCGRYLSNQVLANLLEGSSGFQLGGKRQKITMLTSDLRGFTALSERLAAEEVVKILNLYLGHMTDVIIQYEGTIHDFIGDGILVLFGTPTAKEDHASRAIACAVAMQLAMVAVNETMKEWGLPPLEMGIGIHTGEVVIGNIGSKKRTKYDVVGRNVNLTYRIESYTTGGQILISEQTLKEVDPIVKIEGQKQVRPKGIRQPITIYEVGGIAGEYNLFLSKEEEVFFSLFAELPIHYVVLSGKQISDTLFNGSLVKLSAKGAEVHSDKLRATASVPSPLSALKLNLLIPNNSGGVSEDIYAKSLGKTTFHGNFYIHFTRPVNNCHLVSSSLLIPRTPRN